MKLLFSHSFLILLCASNVLCQLIIMHPSTSDVCSEWLPSTPFMDNYLLALLQQHNMSSLEDLLKIDDPLAYFSRNALYQLNIQYESIQLTGLKMLKPACVKSDLITGIASVGFTAENISLSGTFSGNGTLLGSHQFHGNGSWAANLQLRCSLDLLMKYDNDGKVKFDDGSSKSTPKKEKDRSLTTDQIISDAEQYKPVMLPPKRKQTGQDRRMKPYQFYCSISKVTDSQKFPGLFTFDQGLNISATFTSLLDAYVGQELLVLGKVVFMQTLSTTLGQPLYDQFSQAVQGKSIYEMLNYTGNGGPGKDNGEGV